MAISPARMRNGASWRSEIVGSAIFGSAGSACDGVLTGAACATSGLLAMTRPLDRCPLPEGEGRAVRGPGLARVQPETGFPLTVARPRRTLTGFQLSQP